MTKRSAIAVAMGLVASILVAAVALSMNFQIGTPAVAKEEPVKVAKKAQKSEGPIVKRRTVTVHREKPARIIGGGTVTVPSGGTSSGGGAVSTRSGSGASSSNDGGGSGHESEDHEDQEDEEHEEEHEPEDEGGDD